MATCAQCYQRPGLAADQLTPVVIEEPGRARKRRDVKQRGVFKLADTVPGTWEGSGHEADKLKVGSALETKLTAGKNPRPNAGSVGCTGVR